MAVICPTVTAYDPHQYHEQIERIRPFASRIHIDLMDGQFAPTKSPALDTIWLPHEFETDLHLMYQRPMDHLATLIKLKPRLVIIHAEATVHHMHFVAELHKADILAGLAILQDTPVKNIEQIMHSFDHILVFSGHLGYHGGTADIGLIGKVSEIREHYHHVEIGWDGGINEHNAATLIRNGVNVLNVGGYIQKSPDPAEAYRALIAAIDLQKTS